MWNVSNLISSFNQTNNTTASTPLPPTTQSTGTETERTDDFTKIGGIVGSAVAGGAASYKFSATFSNSLKSTVQEVKTAEGMGNKFKASFPGVKDMAQTSMKAAGIGALISGGISAITNGVDVLRGKKTGAEAVGTFAADTAGGAVSAMTGVAAGGLATFALGAMFTGTPLIAIGVGVGALGALLGDRLFKGSGAYDAIRGSAINGASQK